MTIYDNAGKVTFTVNVVVKSIDQHFLEILLGQQKYKPRIKGQPRKRREKK